MAKRPFRAVSVDTDMTKLWPILPLRDLERLVLFELNDEKRARMEKFIAVRRNRLRRNPRRWLGRVTA